MEQFGPFNTEKRDEVEMLARILLAISLQVERESMA